MFPIFSDTLPLPSPPPCPSPKSGARLLDAFIEGDGTAPKYANLDKVNPGSLILSGEMMFRYIGWTEAADAIIRAMERTIAAETATYDFARLMPGARELKCSEFATALVSNL